MTKVATLAELCAIPPLELRNLSTEKFDELLHTLQTTYPNNATAKKRVQLMLDIRKTLTKANAKDKDKEPVVNSRKTTTPKSSAKTPAGKAKTGEAKSTAKTVKPAKPAAKPTTKPKAEATQGDSLPEQLETEHVHFDRIKVGSQAELSQLLLESPYMIYLFLVEFEEGKPTTTRLNIVYASEELLMLVDKSNQLESFIIVQEKKNVASLIKNLKYTEEGTPAKETFDIAFYKASPIIE